MVEYLLPLASVAAGTLLGLASTVLVSSYRQRQDIRSRFLDQYFQIRKEIVDVVADLANLDHRLRESLEPSQVVNYRAAVSKLFYNNYDLLPEAVLHSLSLLDACLSTYNGRLYTLKGTTIVAMKRDEAVDLIKTISLYANTKKMAPMALCDKNLVVRANQAVALQARSVLYTLNRFPTVRDLLALTKGLKKKSGL
jgi:hypothetical protein